MKRPILYVLAGLALGLTACSSDDEQAQSQEMPIRLSASVNEQLTRANQGVQNQNTIFQIDAQVNIYISENFAPSQVNSASSYAKNGYVFQVQDANGTLMPASSLSYPYYPTNGNSVKIVGMYPKSTLKNVTKSTTSFTIETDQSTDLNYCLSDLMYSDNLTEAAKQPTPQQMTFVHKLSKININLIPASGLTQDIFTQAKVTLLNVVKKINFNGTNGTVSELSETEQAANRSNVLVTNDGYYNSCAIIVPQTVSAGNFIQIRMKAGGDLLDYSLPSDLTFEEGKAYTFNITVKQDAIVVGSYTITDWVEGINKTVPHTDTQFMD